MSLTGKVAVITGGSRGIGLGIAEAFAEAGVRVVVAGVNEERAQQAAAHVSEKYGTAAKGLRADVRERAQIEQLLAETIQAFGQVDILVNSAGTETLAPVWELPEQDWDEVYSVNIKGVYRTCQVFARYMIERGIGGRIINVSSIGGKMGLTYRSHYSSSKSAVDSFTRVIARELIPYKINVNCICPGTVKTDLLEKVCEWEGRITQVPADVIMARCIEGVPLGRAIEPLEVGRVAVFLASEAASALVGQVINVDGGVAPY